MNPGSNPGADTPQLRQVLLERLQERGTLSFAEFMRVALYEPELGYYAKGQSPIGTDKDFFTSVSATPWFGRIVAEVLRKLRAELGETSPFCVYEFGSHGGRLRDDITEAAPELDYLCLEHASPLPDVMRGCVLSNELLDALPFHRLRVVGGEWRELGVRLEGDQFVEAPIEPSDPRLLERLAGLPLEFMEHYETEVSLAAEDWLCEVARRLEYGFVLSFDYGFEQLEYFSPRRAQGGLRCFRQHTVNRDPFGFVGEQDITCDVNFSALMARGEQLGLHTQFFGDQARFLREAGRALIEQIAQRDAGRLSKDRNGLHLLTHPAFLGPRFKILLQKKPLSACLLRAVISS